MEATGYTFIVSEEAPNDFIWAYFVKLRDKFACQDCFSKKNLESHHIDKNQEKKLLINNGITLCNSCHRKHHYNDRSHAIREIPNKISKRIYPEVTKWLTIDLEFEASVYTIKQELQSCNPGETIGIPNLTRKNTDFVRAKLFTTKKLPIKIESFRKSGENYIVYVTRLQGQQP